MRRDSVSRGRARSRRLRGVLAFLLAAIGLGGGHAHAYQARVRWLPNANPDVVGYRIYVRGALRTYTAPVEAGMPQPAADGTMSYVLDGLSAGQTYHFAVSAHSASFESWLSREVSLGPTDSCLVDRCNTLGECEFAVKEDGASCGEGGACELCRAGRCALLAPSELVTWRLLFNSTPTGTRVTLRGIFLQPQGVNPAETGLGLSLAFLSGDPLWERLVPPSALRGNTLGTSFRLVDRNAVPGVYRLVVRLMNGALRINAGIADSDLASLAGRTNLRWTVRLGAELCAVGEPLTCNSRICR